MDVAEGVTPSYLKLAQIKFCLTLPQFKDDPDLKSSLLAGIVYNNMAPYYQEVCTELSWEFDQTLFDKMAANNAKRMAELEQEKNPTMVDDDDPVSGIWQAKLLYLCSIGDRIEATKLAESKLEEKNVPKSQQIDTVFALFRVAYFHGCDIPAMKKAIEKATELIEGGSGGDWSARNKLKAYDGIWSLAIRDFNRAAKLFVDVVPTFESYELADFSTIIKYTVYSSMIAFPRYELKKTLMHHGVMAQALNSDSKELKDYFVSLYEGQYSKFLVYLARIEKNMKQDPLLHPHYKYYVQEMRLLAYKQILQAYRSLSLDYMAESFGVTKAFVEKEVARFAAAGRLTCKIDHVAGAVVTSSTSKCGLQLGAPESRLERGILYQTTVKKGDILLNRLKKLARVMDF